MLCFGSANVWAEEERPSASAHVAVLSKYMRQTDICRNISHEGRIDAIFCSMAGVFFSNHTAAGLVLLTATFFILFSASAWAGLITSDFVLGLYGFRPVQ